MNPETKQEHLFSLEKSLVEAAVSLKSKLTSSKEQPCQQQAPHTQQPPPPCQQTPAAETKHTSRVLQGSNCHDTASHFDLLAALRTQYYHYPILQIQKPEATKAACGRAWMCTGAHKPQCSRSPACCLPNGFHTSQGQRQTISHRPGCYGLASA